MRIELRITLLLLCLVVSAQSAFGVITFTGGSGTNAEFGLAEARGGAYYDIDDVLVADDHYYAEYGIESKVKSWGQGLAESTWKNSIEIVKNPLVGPDPYTPYTMKLAYNAKDPLFEGVSASLQQTSDCGSMDASARIYARGDIEDDGPGNKNIDAWAEIRATSEIKKASGWVESSADGLAGFNIYSCAGPCARSQEVWGSVKGTAKTEASSDLSCGGCCDGTCVDCSGIIENKAFLKTWQNSYIYDDDTDSESESKMGAESVGRYPDTDLPLNGLLPFMDQCIFACDAEGHGWSYVDGFAMGGAWDESTPMTTIKQNGQNENVYTKVEGTLDPIIAMYEMGDKAEAFTWMESYAQEEDYGDDVDLDAFNKAVTFAKAERRAFDEDDRRVVAEAFIENAEFIARAYGEDQNSMALEEAYGMEIASGAHALNPNWKTGQVEFEHHETSSPGWSNTQGWDKQGWKSRAWFTQEAIVDQDGDPSLEDKMRFSIESVGPQFLNSGTMEDDAGSYNRIGSSNVEASDMGELLKISTSAYALNAQDWIEGSDMGANLYKLGDFDATMEVGGSANLNDLDVATEFDFGHSEYRAENLDVDVDDFDND